MMNIELSDMEMRRYSKQIQLDELGVEGQKKLKAAKVLVIGAGGLGTPVLLYLGAAGIGLLGICDNDYVNESNFPRQILYGISDLGKLKTIVAKEKLQLLNPSTLFNIHNIFIKEEIAEFIIKDYDVVVDCTDNFDARYVINDTCNRLNKPLVYGAIYKYEGTVAVFNYNNGGNLRSFFPEKPLAGEFVPGSETGILGVIPGIIGCLQANEVIKIITGIGQPITDKMLRIDAASGVYQLLEK
jgi:adenylyltransferase/sulfurtransferase